MVRLHFHVEQAGTGKSRYKKDWKGVLKGANAKPSGG
jgi:hypothetical protein